MKTLSPSKAAPPDTLPQVEVTAVRPSQYPSIPQVEVTAVRPSQYPSPPPSELYEGRYEPISTLGVGGMGRVLLCRDHHIGRDMALKSLHAHLDDEPGHRARFLREARIQGQLEHPCIVPVYDIDPESAEGASPSFSMRYVRGDLLADIVSRLRRGDREAAARYSRRRLLTAFSSVCGAVHFAHSRGVLHRDLKPENVMLGSFGEVYVLDWGVARVVDDRAPQVDAPLASEYLTQQGEVVGTPGFISPEAWVGDDLDARSDVYSLGAMLYEIITHSAMHKGDTPRDVMRATFTAPWVAPSARRPDLGIPPELDTICATATAVDAEARYATVGDLREAVERFLDGDRDVALRQKAASEAAAEADALATRALAPKGTDDLRGEALQKVGRALALDAENAAAMNTLVRLLLAPPRALPPEVEGSVADDSHQRVRDLARVGVWSYLSWFALLPLLVWMGVRDVPVLGFVSCVMLACAATAHGQATAPRRSEVGGYLLLGTSTLAIASVGLLISPLVLIPTAIVVNTLVFLAHGDRMNRGVTLAAGTLGMFAPAALELLSVLPSTFSITREAIIVHPSVHGLRVGPLLAMIAAAHALVLATSGVAFQRAGSAARRELERLNLMAWNLKQIAPESARGVVDKHPTLRLRRAKRITP